MRHLHQFDGSLPSPRLQQQQHHMTSHPRFNRGRGTYEGGKQEGDAGSGFIRDASMNRKIDSPSRSTVNGLLPHIPLLVIEGLPELSDDLSLDRMQHVVANNVGEDGESPQSSRTRSLKTEKRAKVSLETNESWSGSGEKGKSSPRCCPWSCPILSAVLRRC